ncbi:MAG: hypothetical protein GEU73_05660 [Chloroflexi bacterium]|nr:hypothetical protein [Chloroflexota bacterium]
MQAGGLSRRRRAGSARLLLCAIVAVVVASCADSASPAEHGAASLAPGSEAPRGQSGCPSHAASSRLYLADRSAGSGSYRLIQIDPLTLADLPDCPTIEPGHGAWRLSADGSTLVTYESSRTWNSWTKPEDITFVVRDAATGAERARFHPPEVTYLQDVSPDGSRILLSETGFSVGPSRWFLLDDGGALLTTFQVDELMAFSRRLWWLDSDGRQLGRLIVPRSDTEAGPWPATLVVHDLENGGTPVALPLPSVFAGHWQTERRLRIRQCDGCPIWTRMAPGLAVSPDGQRLAVAHADADALTLVDLDRVAVDRTVALHQPPDLLDLLGLRPRPAHAKVLDGVERQAVFGANGRVYVWGNVWEAGEDGRQDVRRLGLRAIDATDGRILAEALDGHAIDWIEASADGANLYAFGPSNASGETPGPSSIYALRRLDAGTLRIMAEREIRGFREHVLLEEASP